MAKNYRLVLLLIILSSNLFAQSWNLIVLDPQQQWARTRGTIEEATFAIAPKGLYAQVSAYLTFSARGNNFTSDNPLEVVYNFMLPEGSIVNDMWLWIGDKVSNGKIMDLWSASQIYESIVKRKQDPAILKKLSSQSYQLRVYPMLKSETRKVKISYLVPFTWGISQSLINTVSVTIPNELIALSMFPVGKVSLKTWDSPEWKVSASSQFNLGFRSAYDTFFGNHYDMDITINYTKLSLQMVYDSPMADGVYFKHFTQNNEGFYELAWLPTALNAGNPKKVLFLIDYDIRKSTVTKEQLVAILKNQIKANFGNADKFNIMYSGLSVGRISADWISLDKTKIDDALAPFNENLISAYSNLPLLMKEACDYLNKSGAAGSVILLSNSDQLGNNTMANQFITDIKKAMTANYPISVLDFNDKEFVYYYFNNRTYTGNEYLYDNLTRTTGGFYSGRVTLSESALSSLILKLNGSTSIYDLYTTTQTGFCYDRFTLSAKEIGFPVRTPITQVGKFSGEFPFTIKFSGLFNSAPFTQTRTITNAADKKGDETITKTWVGNYINSKVGAGGNIPNSTVNEVIGLSKTHKVLSNYTAFLALENDTSWCSTCYKDNTSGGVNSSVENKTEIPTEFSMDAYPNPFNSQVTITVKLPNNMLGQKVSFKIYNALGQVVKTFSTEAVQGKKTVKLFWDGKNDFGETISSGVYLFSVVSGKFVKTLKLMYMK